ncbi:MAG: methyltransferase domain-containing protein [Chitinophagaceae bacterium]|nr:methyltransferase domain-containing protein [Chitinophagaceae bacterium]MCW5904506.1 methyltransferase domain-containing protein [Chitinophagaceae bacterium]
MRKEAWYKDWFASPYYHQLYQNRDETEAYRFISTLIQYLNPSPNSYMLDVACGKGRHSIALAEMGFNVTGIDLSLPSIEEAKVNETDNLHFFQHDMRLPFWVNYFDYAFNFFTSFGYFRTKREHDNAIRTIANSLKKNGVFVIDYLNVHYAENTLHSNDITKIDDTEFHITRWHDATHFYKQIQVIDTESFAPKHLFTEKIAKFSLGDFTEMLSYQHLQIQEVFGDYQLNSFNIKNSPRLIIIAKKHIK